MAESDLQQRTAVANRVTWVGFFLNLLLTAFKLAAGVIGHSGAMIADAVHSLSDFATDVVVLVSFRFVSKPTDTSHKYGHGKFETLATAVIGLALAAVGAGILWTGAHKIYDGLFQKMNIGEPGMIALVAAVVSIASKEWLYRYTVRAGNRIQSQAVVANAWHHRSDAFSSVGTLLGIGGAIVLGPHWRILDPLAAVIVSFFILKVAFDISRQSIRELVEESLGEDKEREILAIAGAVGGVYAPHHLKTRRIGNAIAVDLHIVVDPRLNVVEAHDIATRVESALREKYGADTHASIHVEPMASSHHDGPEPGDGRT